MIIWEGVEYDYEFDRNTNQITGKQGKLKVHTNNEGYKVIVLSKDSKKKYIKFHRFLYWMYHPLTDFTLSVDHEDNNKSNNNISNLRLATRSEQGENRNKQLNTSSKYFNVYEDRGKWRAYVTINKKLKHIGLYSSEREAAIAYNNYVISNNLNNGFRKLNVIEPKKTVNIKKRQL